MAFNFTLKNPGTTRFAINLGSNTVDKIQLAKAYIAGTVTVDKTINAISSIQATTTKIQLSSARIVVEYKKTIKPSGQGGDYTSLASWEATEQQDLVANNRYAVAEIDGDWSGGLDSSGGVTIDPWTTSSSCYILIKAIGTARHIGVYDQNYYCLDETLVIYPSNVFVEGIQLVNNSGCIYNYGISNTFNSIICYSTSTSTTGRIFGSYAGSSSTIINCISISSSNSYMRGFGLETANNIIIYNCLAVRCLAGYRQTNTGIAYMTNCVSQLCADGFIIGNISGDHNCSDITSDAPGTSPITGSILFLDEPNNDFRLSPYDTVAQKAGAVIYSDVPTDIAGNSRGTSSATVFDIGAHHSVTEIRTIKPTGQGGNYTTLSVWEAAEQLNLIINNHIAIAEIDGDWSSTTDTTAVTINGWTTGTSNYIEIRAVNTAIHDGKLNTTKYKLQTSNSECIRVVEEYVRIYGLQLIIDSVNAIDKCCINAWDLTAGGSIVIDRCIFKGITGALYDYHTGIQLYNGNYGTMTVTNSVFFNFSGASVGIGGIYKYGLWNLYAFNCTSYNCSKGYFNSGGAGVFLAKNCLAQTCTDGFNGTFSASSTNNCSDIASDAPVTNRVTGTVQFADAANGNFHLSYHDTVAKGSGIDLSGDFTDDIDGQTRTGAWDIGADQNINTEAIEIIPAQSRIQIISERIQSARANLTAGFTTVDRIQLARAAIDASYTESTKIISARSTILSATPPSEYKKTIKPSGQGGDYTSLSAWEAAEQQDLIVTNRYAVAEIQGDWSGGGDTTATLILNGWRAWGDYYIEIRTDAANKATATWDTTKYIFIPSTTGNVITLNEGVRLIGLQIGNSNTGATGTYGIYAVLSSLGELLFIDGCFIDGTNMRYGIRPATPTAGDTVVIRNCVINDCRKDTDSTGILTGYENIYVQNNTVFGCVRGMYIYRVAAILEVINNVCAGQYRGIPRGFMTLGIATVSKNNASSDDTADDKVGSTGCRINQTFSFINSSTGNFHLSVDDTGAKGYGYDLSSDPNWPLTVDIDGQTRTTWDIGADGYVQTTETKNITSQAFIIDDVAVDIGWVELELPITYETTDKNILAKSRISVVNDKLQLAIARISASNTYTQTSKASISSASFDTVTQTILAKANIFSSTTKTQPALARISVTNTYIQPAIANISAAAFNTVTQIIPAKASISNWSEKLQTAIARIQRSGISIQSAKANILATTSKIQLSKARVIVEYKKTIKPSGQGGDYTSLSAWESTEQQDLVTNNRYAVAEIDGNWNGVSDSPVTIDGWNTSVDSYIEIRTTKEARHYGSFDSNQYTIKGFRGSDNGQIGILENNVRLIGLQIEITGSIGDCCGIRVVGANVLIDSCILKGFISSAVWNEGILFFGGNSGPTIIRNCCIFNFNGNSSDAAIYNYDGTPTITALNNTYVNCWNGHYNVTATLPISKNCLAQSCVNGFNGSFNATSTNNGSDIAADAPGSNPVTGTVKFVEPSKYNYHLLSTDTVAKGAGADLSSDFTTDIDGQIRVGAWDIGADQELEKRTSITAISRITSSQTKLQTAIARITNFSLKTQTAIARISNYSEKIQIAKSRIQVSNTEIQLAKANISATTTKTISAVGRIGTGSIVKTQLAKANIYNASNRLQLAISRIQKGSIISISAISRIQKPSISILPARARIQKSQTRIISGLSRIQKSSEKLLTAISRITKVNTYYVTAISRIYKTVTRIQLAIARIGSGDLRKIQLAKAAIRKTVVSITSAIGRIQKSNTRIITSKARILGVNDKLILAIARIRATSISTILAKSSIRKTETRIINSIARIAKSQTPVQLSRARISATSNKLQYSISAIRKTEIVLITAVARITFSGDKILTAKARIQAQQIRSVTGIARIQKSGSYTIPAISRIQVVKNNLITARARINLVQSKLQLAVSRIQNYQIKTVLTKAAIKQTVNKLTLAIGRIQKGQVFTITGIASIQYQSTYTIPCVASILNSLNIVRPIFMKISNKTVINPNSFSAQRNTQTSITNNSTTTKTTQLDTSTSVGNINTTNSVRIIRP